MPTVASKRLLLDHPELYHYTTGNGLVGILKSNTIWATHFSDLNDATEVRLLREPLIKALSGRFKELVREHQSGSVRIRKAVAQHGGVQRVSAELANDLVNSLYSVTFGGAESTDFGIPFVASFCSHADQAYESEHGLLSQWRGYGRDGGYCLVFDTAKLSKLLEQEINSNFYVHMNLSDTRYALDGVSVEQLFPELLERCDFFVSRMLKGNMTPAPDDGFAPFVIGATMFKHQGFREEREVRIVAMPGSKALFDHVRAQHNQIPQMSIKQMNTIHSSRGKRRYISLFEGNSVTLPIKRVIVGPSRHQAANVAHAQNLLGKDIAISASATPFVD